MVFRSCQDIVRNAMIFLTFDRTTLLDALKDRPWNWYLTPKDDIDPLSQKHYEAQLDVPPSKTIGTAGSSRTAVSGISLNRVWAKPKYYDQLPPFNVVISAENEYGSHARMDIIGVEIMNQGSGMSIDDLSIDEACTFVAQEINPLYDQRTIEKPE